MSARDMSAARRTPIIGAFPKILVPLVIVIPGMIAAAISPGLTRLKATGDSDLTYNDALAVLMRDLLPNGLLGVAVTGLLASFMAGMAANISSFNTVFTYDLWQGYIARNRPDSYYLSVGRWVTVIGTMLAIGTAFIAAGYGNIMNYIQALASIFNAPLFTTFIIGMFWKRMTPAAGWAGLLAGTVAALGVYVVSEAGVLVLPGQGAAFLGAAMAFIVDAAVSVAVTLRTRPKAEADLVGLVYQLTPQEQLRHDASGKNAGWYRSPRALSGLALALAIGVYLVIG